jgi:hypothetical protein
MRHLTKPYDEHCLARSIPECDLGEGGISGMEQYAEAAEREDMLGERWWYRGL